MNGDDYVNLLRHASTDQLDFHESNHSKSSMKHHQFACQKHDHDSGGHSVDVGNHDCGDDHDCHSASFHICHLLSCHFCCGYHNHDAHREDGVPHDQSKAFPGGHGQQ